MIKSAMLKPMHIRVIGVSFVVILLIAGVIGCSGGTSSNAGVAGSSKNTNSDKLNSQEEKEEAEESSTPSKGLIKRAYFSPFYDAVNGKSLKINVETILPKSVNQYFIYHYWNNFHKVAEKSEEDNIIPYSSFKTGDYLYVDVLLYEDGELIEKKRSKGLLVKNTAPAIEDIDIPEIDGPGTYEIPVKVNDPEGDKLTFSLEGKPLFKGLTINSETGTITLVMDSESPPRELKFRVNVTDGKGGVTKKDVSILFKINNQKESGGST